MFLFTFLLGGVCSLLGAAFVLYHLLTGESPAHVDPVALLQWQAWRENQPTAADASAPAPRTPPGPEPSGADDELESCVWFAALLRKVWREYAHSAQWLEMVRVKIEHALNNVGKKSPYVGDIHVVALEMDSLAPQITSARMSEDDEGTLLIHLSVRFDGRVHLGMETRVWKIGVGASADLTAIEGRLLLTIPSSDDPVCGICFAEPPLLQLTIRSRIGNQASRFAIRNVPKVGPLLSKRLKLLVAHELAHPQGFCFRIPVAGGVRGLRFMHRKKWRRSVKAEQEEEEEEEEEKGVEGDGADEGMECDEAHVHDEDVEVHVEPMMRQQHVHAQDGGDWDGDGEHTHDHVDTGDAGEGEGDEEEVVVHHQCGSAKGDHVDVVDCEGVEGDDTDDDHEGNHEEDVHEEEAVHDEQVFPLHALATATLVIETHEEVSESAVVSQVAGVHVVHDHEKGVAPVGDDPVDDDDHHHVDAYSDDDGADVGGDVSAVTSEGIVSDDCDSHEGHEDAPKKRGLLSRALRSAKKPGKALYHMAASAYERRGAKGTREGPDGHAGDARVATEDAGWARGCTLEAQHLMSAFGGDKETYVFHHPSMPPPLRPCDPGARTCLLATSSRVLCIDFASTSSTDAYEYAGAQCIGSLVHDEVTSVSVCGTAVVLGVLSCPRRCVVHMVTLYDALYTAALLRRVLRMQ